MFTRSRSNFLFSPDLTTPSFYFSPKSVRREGCPPSPSSVRNKRLHLAHRQDDLPSSKLFSTKRPKRCLSAPTHAVGVTWLASIEMFANVPLNLAQIHVHTFTSLRQTMLKCHIILILVTDAWYKLIHIQANLWRLKANGSSFSKRNIVYKIHVVLSNYRIKII